MTSHAPPPLRIRHGVAARAHGGSDHCGDQALVEARGPDTLVAVVDGLGHGPDAEHAARRATETLRARDGVDPVGLLRACHDRLRRTRGAAISLVVLGPQGARWLAVGNVQGVLCRADGTSTRLVTRGGIVGGRLPALRTTTLELADGDVLAMFTDGVGEGAARSVRAGADPQEQARDLLEHHATGSDDGLVLVAACHAGPT